MTDAALPLQSEADQRAIAAIRRKNAVWRRILRDPPAAVAALFLIVIVGSAILAPWIAPFDPYASNMRLRLCPIGGARCPDFLLGADNQGRDMVSRILFGLRATLGIGIAAVLVGGGLGALIGLSAAYFKRLDQPLMRLIDVLLSFPSILFGLAIAAVMGTGLFSLVVALSIASIPSIARIARGAAQSIMQQEYMEAGRAVGLGDGALIWRYLAARRSCWARRSLSSASAHSRRPPSWAAWPPTAASSCRSRRMSRPCPARRSSSWFWHSTCWATRCATLSIRSCGNKVRKEEVWA